MKTTSTKVQKSDVKSFTVRLKTPEERAAWEARCADVNRSLDGHACYLIRQDLIAHGYIKSTTPRKRTQS